MLRKNHKIKMCGESLLDALIAAGLTSTTSDLFYAGYLYSFLDPQCFEVVMGEMNKEFPFSDPFLDPACKGSQLPFKDIIKTSLIWYNILVPTLVGVGSLGFKLLQSFRQKNQQDIYEVFIKKNPEYRCPEGIESQTIKCPILMDDSNKPVLISFEHNGFQYRQVYDYEALKPCLAKDSRDLRSNIDLLSPEVKNFNLSFYIPPGTNDLLNTTLKLEKKYENIKFFNTPDPKNGTENLFHIIVYNSG